MMKKALLSMILALVGISAWAQTFDASKLYTLRASGSSVYVTTTEKSSTGGNGATTYQFAAEPEKFVIAQSGTGWTIKSATTDKYIGVNQWNAVNAEYAWKIDVVDAATNTYKINLQGQSDKGLGWDNAAAGEGIYTDKSGKSWVIEEYVEGVQILTLSYTFNEGKTQATVTVEGLTGNGTAYWFFAGDDEPQAEVEDGTFGVAPLSFPATVNVVVREYDDTFETVYAEGNLSIIFPGQLDVDASKYYTLRTARGYMPASEDKTTLWGAQYIVSVNNAEDAGKFRIEGELNNCTIYNVQLHKYLSANESDVYAEGEADGTFSIINASEFNGGRGDAWIIKSNVTDKWLMFGGSNQYTNNSGWKQTDDGDQWFIEETEYTEPVVTAELTLSYVLNETKTAATVTVEGLTGEGYAVYFLDEDFEEPAGFEGTTFEVAPISAPATVKVTVREVNEDMSIIYSEGEISIEFPEITEPEEPETVLITAANIDQLQNGSIIALMNGQLSYEGKAWFTGDPSQTIVEEAEQAPEAAKFVLVAVPSLTRSATSTYYLKSVESGKYVGRSSDIVAGKKAIVMYDNIEDAVAVTISSVTASNANVYKGERENVVNVVADVDDNYKSLNPDGSNSGTISWANTNATAGYPWQTFRCYLVGQENGAETAIETVEAGVNSNAIYNLNGQRINAAQRGIYIVGGRKVVVR